MGVRLVATKVLRYAGQRYTPGEPFRARTHGHARVLKALGRAVDEPKSPAAQHVPFSMDLSFRIDTSGSITVSTEPEVIPEDVIKRSRDAELAD